MASASQLKPGDRVSVPWGLDEIDGVVIEVYGPPGQRHVLVRVPVRGSTGETLEETEVSFPERSLKALAP